MHTVIARFDTVEIDLDGFSIRVAGAPVHVEPQVFEVVRVLVENRHRLVPKDELLDTIWGTRFVSESSLTSRIRAARAALGDDGRTQRVIQTVHGRGYRFVAVLDEGSSVAGASTSVTREPAPAGPATPAPPVGARGLIERDDALAVLASAVADAAHGEGRVVTVSGEPGIGKTAVVRAFARALAPEVRLVSGACDDLVTPRALGPFHDMVDDLPRLGDVLGRSAPGEVPRALLREVSEGPGPLVVVIEDVHWADEATIDTLTTLVRRVDDVPLVLVLTYRHGGITMAHPLLRVLGSPSPVATRHVRLEPLTTAGIARLVGEERAGQVAEVTGGVPLFVSEVAALGPSTRSALPTSVSHAVLARTAALPDPTRALLDRLSVEPTRTETRVLDGLHPGWLEAAGAAERAAVIVADPGSLAFRHELVRLAVLDAVPETTRRVLHGEMAEALAAAGADPARIVHHAAAAQRDDLVLEHAVAAAEGAAAASSHRESWSHLQRVLPLLDGLPVTDVPGVLEMASREAHYAGAVPDSLDLAEQSRRAFEEAGDVAGTGRLRLWLSRVHWIQGDGDEAGRQSRLAVEALEPLGPSEELAWAYGTLSQLAMLAWREQESIDFGERAVELADEVGAPAVRAHAMVTLATVANRVTDRDEAVARRAVDAAKEAGAHHEVVRGLINFAHACMEADDLEPAGRVAAEALAYAEEYDIATLRDYLRVMVARIDFLHGRWTSAERALKPLTGVTTVVPRMVALGTLAQLRVRRGDAQAEEMLRAYRHLVDSTHEPERLVPAVENQAEHAWLCGRLPEVVPDLLAVVGVAAHVRAHEARIARWLQEAGVLDALPPDAPEPHLAELEGRWADAADGWRSRGMPYEEAVALAHAGAEGRTRARVVAEALGAAPLLALLAEEPD